MMHPRRLQSGAAAVDAQAQRAPKEVMLRMCRAAAVQVVRESWNCHEEQRAATWALGKRKCCCSNWLRCCR